MTDVPKQLYRKDTRSPNSPYHPALSAPCGHPFDAPHSKVHWANKPESIGGYTCDQDAPRIEGTQTTAFPELGPPQLELF